MATRPLLLPDGLDPVARRCLNVPPDAELPEGALRLAFGDARSELEEPVFTGEDFALATATAPSPERFSLDLPRGRELELTPGDPQVWGILNVTPDSFHDGDASAGPAEHVDRARAMLAAGAAALDIGGESTRPGAEEVPAEEEIRRTAPVIRALREDGAEALLSIDTSKAAVARAALEAGADLVNDVTGGAGDPEMLPLVAAAGCPYVLMHMRGTPRTMKGLAEYAGWPVTAIALELAGSIERAREAGVRTEQLITDPGIGFAKDWRQSLECLRRLDVFTGLGRPVLVGASRKSLLRWAAGSGTETSRRLPGSIVLAAHAARRGAAILRVHDVAETVQALRTQTALERGLEAEDLG